MINSAPSLIIFPVTSLSEATRWGGSIVAHQTPQLRLGGTYCTYEVVSSELVLQFSPLSLTFREPSVSRKACLFSPWRTS